MFVFKKEEKRWKWTFIEISIVVLIAHDSQSSLSE